MGRLDGKVALITGAGRGVGRGIALALAREGADIALAEIDPETAARTTAEIEALGRRAVCVVCDIGSRAACEAVVERTVEELGGLDILINNAAANPYYGPATGLPPEAFDKTVAVNLKGPYYFMSNAVPLMIESGGGAIVNVASIAALLSMPGQAVYSMTKAGLISITLSLIHI